MSVGLACVTGCAISEPALKLTTPQALFDPGRGYRFAALPAPGTSVIWLDVRYPVGFADDPVNKPGLAHLVEHLLFNVELPRTGRKTSIDAELRRLTLSRNAITSADSTTYRALLNPSALDEVLALEAERMTIGCAGITPETFARERAVVIEEQHSISTPTRERIERAIHETAYPPGHPYRRVQSTQSLAKLELSDVCAFLAGPYRRGTAIVVAAGAVDQKRLAQAARAFDRLPVRSQATEHALAPARLAATVSHRELPVRDPQVIALWPLPPRGTRAFRLLRLVWPIIPAHLNISHSTYKAKAEIVGGGRAPVLAITATLQADSEAFTAIDDIKVATDYLLTFLDRENVVPRVWSALWQDEAAVLLSDWDSLDSRSRLFADYLQFEHGRDYLAERMHELSTTEPWLASVPARRVLTSNRAHFLVINTSEGPPLLEASEERSFGGEIENHETMVDPASADQPLPLPSLPAFPRAQTLRYGNGMTVVLWPHGTTPLVRGALVVRSGWVNEPAGEEGVARLIGASGMVFPDNLVFGDAPHLVSRSNDLVQSLMHMLRPDLRLGLRDGWRERVRQQMLRRREIAKYYVDQRMALYGRRHAYARAPVTDDSLAGIDERAVKTWLDRHVVAGNATLVITGNFTPRQLQGDIAVAQDWLRDGRGPRDVTDVPQPKQAWLAGTVDEPRPAVQLEVAFVGGRGIDADHAKRLVLEAVLAEKLFELRERRALSYAPSADYEPRRAGGQWSVTAVVDNARAAEGAAALVQLLSDLRRNPESYRAAFVLARQKVLERLLANSGSSRQALAELVQRARFDLDDTRHGQLATDVAALTLPAFHRFVAREFAEAGQVFGALGNTPAVTAALEAAKHIGDAAKPAGETAKPAGETAKPAGETAKPETAKAPGEAAKAAGGTP